MIYRLPLPQSPELFERIVCDLLNSSYNTTSFALYGRKGQSQNGTDIISFEHHTHCQCKLRTKSDLDRKDKEILIKELISDANKILDNNIHVSKIIFAVSIRNDTDVQDHISTLATLSGVNTSFEFWSWDRISDSIFLYDNILNKYFPFRKDQVELFSASVLNKTIYKKTDDNFYSFTNDKRVNQLPIFDFSFANNSTNTTLLTKIEALSAFLPIAKAGTYPKPAGTLKVTKKYKVHLTPGLPFSDYKSVNVDISDPIYIYPKSPFRIQIQADKPITSYMKVKFIFHFNKFKLSTPETYFNARVLQSGRIIGLH